MEEEIGKLVLFTIGFAVVALASQQIGKLFLRLRLPLITGFLITGIAAGPFVLGLLDEDKVDHVNYLNDISLAFIAFAAGSELYLKELRSRIKSITYNTFGQLVITMVLGSLSVYFLAEQIPFMKSLGSSARWAVALLAGVIFVARSPASAIAIINEMRAKGPFVSVALGVTVVKDVLVIILFTIVFALSDSLITDSGLGGGFLLILLLELGVAFGLGIVLGKLIAFILRENVPLALKTTLIMALGYGIYLLSHATHNWSHELLGFEMHLEPLLICIIGSFYVTNYSNSRNIFHESLEQIGPAVYVVFFTLTGAAMKIDILLEVWSIALILFGVRLVSMVVAGYVGGALGGDPKEFRAINWMPYVTQAGVGLGLAIVVADKYPAWGNEFQTVVIGVIVLNQIVGPPLFKWAITRVGEDHIKKPTPDFDGVRDAIIFGLRGQSMSLARQLSRNGWQVKLVTFRKDIEEYKDSELVIVQVEELTPEVMEKLDTHQAEAIVAMMSDEENMQVCELAYEYLGTKDMIVVANDPARTAPFRELGAIVVHPSTAIVSLLDHAVRSPLATRLILGMEEDQDTIEVEVMDETLHGVLLRDLKLPQDVIVLSVRRKAQVIIPHGYTRLRKKDQITVVGSRESLEEVALMMAPLPD